MAPSLVVIWSWAALRVWAILRAQVLWRAAVGPWWWLVAAGLSLVLAPAAIGQHVSGLDTSVVDALAGMDPATWILVGLLELLVGTMIGLLAALPGHALVGAAQASSGLLGLSTLRSRGLIQLAVALVLVMGLSLEIHHPLLGGLLGTFAVFPLGKPETWLAFPADGFVTTVAMAAHSMTVLALALLTPVLLACLIADVVARLLGRGPGAAEPVAGALRPWLRVALALTALGASWAAYPEAWSRALG
jgi:flagellar biosynthesis protein FliR